MLIGSGGAGCRWLIRHALAGIPAGWMPARGFEAGTEADWAGSCAPEKAADNEGLDNPNAPPSQAEIKFKITVRTSKSLQLAYPLCSPQRVLKLQSVDILSSTRRLISQYSVTRKRQVGPAVTSHRAAKEAGAICPQWKETKHFGSCRLLG